MVSNFDIDNQIKRNIFYFKLQKDIIDAKNTRSAMVSLRNKWVQSQIVKNYQDEYMRLRDAFSKSSVAMNGKPTSEYIKENEKNIPKLSEQMFQGIKNKNTCLEAHGAKPITNIY